MNALDYTLSFAKGRKRIVIWGIINSCNCKCRMCSMWKQKPSAVKNYTELIDFMAKNKVLFLSLTGGEPLLHPKIMDIIKYAKKKGFYVHVASNGTLLTLNKAKELKNAGLDLISFSIDHHTSKVQDYIRRHKDEQKKAIKAIKNAKAAGLDVSTSTVLTKLNIKDIKKTIEFICKKLNTSFTLCTPHFSETESFFEKESKEITLSKDELINAAEKIINLKKEGYNITNSYEFLNDYINWMKGKPKYHCQSGELAYYLDSKGDFFPCFNKGKIFDIKTGWKNKNLKCFECNIQCFKEPSVVNQLGLIDSIKYLINTRKSFK